jgi:arylsulfatase A-like enzyme/Flp pilus assembly protein TadD
VKPILRKLASDSRAAGIILTLFLCVVTGSSIASRAAEIKRSPDVLLITVDTLRADHLACYGYRQIKTPNIDQLAREGVRFEHAYSQVPLTLPSHVAILTGTYPMYNHVRDFTGIGLPPDIGIISEAFKRHGYATAAFVSAYVLDGSWGLRRGFDVYDDRFDPEQYESRNPGNIQRRGDKTVDQFLAWFAHRPAKPFFVWIHLYDPHSPYDPPEPFHSEYAGHLYDGEIAYADAQIGRVFKALQEAKVYNQTLITFMSDHGESLGEHGEDEHGFFIYNATIHIPLIIKLPGTARKQSQTVASVAAEVDVAPTLLQFAGLSDPLSRQFQGRSLAALISAPGASENRSAYSETVYPFNSFGWSPLHALISRRYAYIEAPQPELYDLQRDPGEKQNIFAQHRAETNAFKAELDGLEKRYTARSEGPGGPPLPQETLEKLKSLGYLAYSAPAIPASEMANLPDPKSEIQVFNTTLRAMVLSQEGHFEESSRLIRQMAGPETRLYLFPFILAENAMRQGRLKEAQSQFLASLKLNPDFITSIRGLARAYHADRQNDKAKPLLELILHKNPHDFLAHYGLGLIASDGKDYAEAIRQYQAAVREKPDYGPAEIGLGVALVESRRYEEALPYLRSAEGTGPQEIVRLNYFGIAMAHSGNFPRAIELYQQALAQKPDYTAARLNLAIAYRQSGDMEKARKEFKILCDSGSALCQQFRSYFE